MAANPRISRITRHGQPRGRRSRLRTQPQFARPAVSSRAVVVRLATVIALLVLAGCGGDDADEPASTPTPNPTSEAAPQGSAANAFIGSLAVDPGDGTLMIGTGLGLFRLRSGAGEPERVTG